jgi:outer membrane murein-binding lipoprotein Lpp
MAPTLDQAGRDMNIKIQIPLSRAVRKLRSLFASVFMAGLMLAPIAATAADPAAASTPRSLEADVQSLRKDVLELNKDLSALEEELLFPANTQVAVFLSLDVGAFFELDAVQLRLDNKEVANYLYTEREIAALNRGGVHRVFLR